MLSLLSTRRWLGFTVMAVVVVVSFTLLGRWQLHRAQDRGERAQELRTRVEAEPVDVTQLTEPGTALRGSAQWRTVSARGTYAPAGTVLLRNRSIEGQRGYHLLVPLALADGTTVLVDRGFLPAAGDPPSPADLPVPPAGQVSVQGRLDAGDRVDGPADLGLDGGGAAGVPSVSRVEPVALGAAMTGRLDSGAGLRGGLVEATSEDPAPAAALTRIPRPEAEDYGLNYAYMVQWWVFAAIGVGGWWVLLRREARDAGARGGAGTALRAVRA